MGSKAIPGGLGVIVALGLSGASLGCGGEDDWSATDETGESADVEGVDGVAGEELLMSSERAVADGSELELGTAQQSLLLFDIFDFESSCSDPNGTYSVMAGLAVATATELKRWQPTKDFRVNNGKLELTSTGKAQCADGRCWNTQAILDLQSAPAGSVQVHPGVTLDSRALRSGLTTNVIFQVFSLLSYFAPDHKFQLLGSQPGGCDQFYWFNVTSPSGGAVSSLLTSLLKEKLAWVGGSQNPYIQFESDGTRIGIVPTSGLNEAGSALAGSCSAACTKISSTDISGTCCSCNGTKRFVRSTFNASTYLCQ